MKRSGDTLQQQIQSIPRVIIVRIPRDNKSMIKYAMGRMIEIAIRVIPVNTYPDLIFETPLDNPFIVIIIL